MFRGGLVLLRLAVVDVSGLCYNRRLVQSGQTRTEPRGPGGLESRFDTGSRASLVFTTARCEPDGLQAAGA